MHSSVLTQEVMSGRRKSSMTQQTLYRNDCPRCANKAERRFFRTKLPSTLCRGPRIMTIWLVYGLSVKFYTWRGLRVVSLKRCDRRIAMVVILLIPLLCKPRGAKLSGAGWESMYRCR
jgi:hypothetical protein